MDSKIYSLVITSILSFALIVGIPKTFENDINAQEDGTTTDITPGGDMKRINQVKESGVEWFRVNLIGQRMMEIRKNRKIMTNRIENFKHFVKIFHLYWFVI